MAVVMIIGFGGAILALLALAQPWRGYGEPEAPHAPQVAPATADVSVAWTHSDTIRLLGEIADGRPLSPR